MFPSSRGSKYILVAVDYLSKWVEAKVLPTNDARVVCKFLKNLFARFGTPRAIISDRGTHFCNDKFAKVMQKFGVTHRLATPCHPQTSGQVEVSNRGLKRILEREIGENRASWSDKLDDALWAFRIAYKTPIGCTPYKLDKTKRLHDSKIKDRVFNIGDRVLLFNSHLKIFFGKLKSRWSGPFTISQVYPYGTVELSQPDGSISKLMVIVLSTILEKTYLSVPGNLKAHAGFCPPVFISSASFGNHELEQMKEIAKEKQLPPVYTGKWATATEEEVQEELAKGTPFTYRFRVPKEGSLKINDLIRGEVTWNLDTLGDFVVMRSNGQPVYNFCVTVDDATMAITHVIRAEEHLPNTLRQALIYKALEFPMPSFAHVSLILAPDRSKLSKRHGATSVGQFREMGFLPQAIVNYLALLGWSDGTNDEFFTLDQLVEKFSITRVNKSGAIFDSTKLRWMNGQHLKALPTEELIKTIGEQWRSAGILIESEGLFVEDAYKLLEGGMDVITDAEKLMSDLLSYPFHDTLSRLDADLSVHLTFKADLPLS
nr:glutamate--tRNA ligase, chloroplastic/mitochondrial [Tanacetum cinerariifolium]